MDNQFMRMKFRREQAAKSQKDCNHVWYPRFDYIEDDHKSHKCKRKLPHKANHKCGCGATKKTKMLLR